MKALRCVLCCCVMVVLVVVAGCSSPSATEVTVSLSEFRIEASQSSYIAGTRYKFMIENGGTIPHEWSITAGGAGGHEHALKAVEDDELVPGRSATAEYTFTESGDFEFACHLPGHYEAGMKAAISVQ